MCRWSRRVRLIGKSLSLLEVVARDHFAHPFIDSWQALTLLLLILRTTFHHFNYAQLTIRVFYTRIYLANRIAMNTYFLISFPFPSLVLYTAYVLPRTELLSRLRFRLIIHFTYRVQAT